MGNAEFEFNCVKIIDDFLNNEGLENEDFSIYIVWMCKTLQNNKALLSTSRENDTRYYEITYDGNADVFYVDCYRKEWNQTLPARLERMGV